MAYSTSVTLGYLYYMFIAIYFTYMVLMPSKYLYLNKCEPLLTHIQSTELVENISKKLNSDKLIGRLFTHFMVNPSLSKEEYWHLRGTDFKSTYKTASLDLQITRCAHPWLPKYQKLFGNIVCERDGVLYIRHIWKRYIIDASRK